MRFLPTFFLAFLACLLPDRGAAQANDTLVVLRRLGDVANYVGTYPCSNGILRSPVLLHGLSRVLLERYKAYRDHMSLAGCGAIEQRGDYTLMDVSQLHVGGYTSLILVREPDEAIFLFWLSSTVAERTARVYGPRPVPAEALDIFRHEMNSSWGHVACFTVDADSLAIDLTRRANQDTGECHGK